MAGAMARLLGDYPAAREYLARVPAARHAPPETSEEETAGGAAYLDGVARDLIALLPR